MSVTSGSDPQSSTTQGASHRKGSLRLAILDPTLTGNGTATGELKRNLLTGWQADQIHHIYRKRRGQLADSSAPRPLQWPRFPASRKRLTANLAAFLPDCVIYRPVPDERQLHRLAMDYLRKNSVPLICWMMDDWPERLRYDDDPRHEKYDDDLHWLFERATIRLCISDDMRDAYQHRYGKQFLPIANGIDPLDWPSRHHETNTDFVVRYAGSLAQDMVLDSVIRVARVIEQLAEEGHKIRFEINTRPAWKRRTAGFFRSFDSCQITTHSYRAVDYRNFLQTADLLLLAYNFDDRSRIYVRYSLANKLPECLIAGPPLLVHGPPDVATVRFVADRLPAAAVTEPEDASLRTWLKTLLTSPSKQKHLAEQARAVALAEFQIHTRREALLNAIDSAVQEPSPTFLYYAEHEARAQLDESRIVDYLTRSSVGSEHVMLDVGAHRGASMLGFANRGWTVYAFEPDAANRARLIARFKGQENVLIDPRAVAEQSRESQRFYHSTVSDGISSMVPFHPSHQNTDRVDVTTVSEIATEHEIQRIDFLKIDVEGMDFAVLQGVPWEALVPGIVLCEFEDSKTENLGHSWRQVADYLNSRNYAVYVSEWYPIEQYGSVHRWRSMRKYPCDLSDNRAWGNLMAFRRQPEPDDLASAILENVSYGHSLFSRMVPLIRRTASRVYRRLSGTFFGTR